MKQSLTICWTDKGVFRDSDWSVLQECVLYGTILPAHHLMNSNQPADSLLSCRGASKLKAIQNAAARIDVIQAPSPFCICLDMPVALAPMLERR